MKHLLATQRRLIVATNMLSHHQKFSSSSLSMTPKSPIKTTFMMRSAHTTSTPPPPPPQANNSSTVDESEVEFFSNMARAKEWWNPTGKLKTLHQINPFRIKYIKNKIVAHNQQQAQEQQQVNNALEPLKGLRILDVGCGGGLASESLARLGADVTALDASFNNIQVAMEHKEYALKGTPVYDRLNYRHCTAEQLLYEMTHEQANTTTMNVNSGMGWFDVVVSLEVVEHVSHLQSFTNSLASFVKPGGALFMSTLSRTPKSFLFAIAAAEYLLRLVPPGTHDWQKFLKPEELTMLLEANGLDVQEIIGVDYNPVTEKLTLTDDLSVNYQLFATKPLIANN